MAATVFLCDTAPAVGTEFVLDGDEGRHAAVVRRIRVGERVVLSDGQHRLDLQRDAAGLLRVVSPP